MIILHGEQTIQSREKLLQLITTAKTAERRLERLETTGVTLAKLEEAVGATDLFGQPKTIIIEGLHSLQRSKKKDELLSLVASIPESSELEIILWENRSLTKTMLKQFPTAAVFEFKISSAVFSWLDSLSPQPATKTKQLTLLHKATASEDAFMCFAMLTRQVRLLIQARDGGVLKGAPFMIVKLKKQAQAFSLDQLLSLHTKLLEIDLRQKTSTGWLNLTQELDLLLLQL